MNPNPPSNPGGYPGQDPSDPHEQTQLRPTWQSGENAQFGAPSNPQYPAQPAFAPPGGQGPQGPGAPGFPPAPGAPKKPRPGWLIPALIGGGAVLLVIVLIAGIAIVKSVGGGGDTGSPGATVKAYFAALQAGDAKKALSYGKEAPASTELLTDEVLRKQRDLAPIKDLKIVSESGGYMGTVHLTVTIGQVSYDEELSMEKVGDDWKLATAAVQLKPYFSYDSDKKNVTILGKPLPESGVVYVFPGALDLGSSNKNLVAQKSKYSSTDDKGQASVKGLSRFSVSGSLNIGFGLSDAAKTSVRQQIAARYSACAASKDGYPSGCPQSDFSGEKGTYSWTAPNVDEIDLSGDVRDGQLSISGSQVWNFTATGRDGRPITGSDSGYVSSTVTVTADAVAVSSR
ncbi:DUF4878 domain-containing protein [Tsukamurella pseudospumae]|uniref:DUF4878 domain-containing protein n=1 Tax=Tsukamurella pseudospumae TaxID=239498 RepID=A0A137ZLR8_9ACTN|nr:DUF4878 domain-containing protein [Tsukamurella pseudospumae]KXO99124.1 hypothetical protein AXK61_17765 [Tsukamurella pseudospumae]